MKAIVWIVRIMLFLVALTFALKNTDPVTVHYYLGVQWQAPLIFVILVTFFLGGIAGVFLTLPPIVRLRRQNALLQKKDAAAQSAASVAADESKRISDAL